MRVFVHDFGGYPFPVQLSRELARRGHQVLHAYCGSLYTTPHGSLQKKPDDPAQLDIRSIELNETLSKYAFIKRWLQENKYGHLTSAEIRRFQPDILLSANTPLDAQRTLLKMCRKNGIPSIFWLQDLIGVAADRILREKIPFLGAIIGKYYLNLEQRLLHQSDRIILITSDFGSILEHWGINRKKMHVIENWAPLDEIPVRPKDNPWSRKNGLADKTCFLYSGTMGMKHNPELLLELARTVRDRPDIHVVVISQGLGADWLTRKKEEQGLHNLIVMGYQPFEQVPDVLATADVLVAVLESNAAAFSVPSKVLSYLCAGRPLLLAVPDENLAARIVKRNKAGLTVEPDDTRGFIAAAENLISDPVKCAELAQNARRYAEETFDITRIADAFEHILTSLVK